MQTRDVAVHRRHLDPYSTWVLNSLHATPDASGQRETVVGGKTPRNATMHQEKSGVEEDR